MTGPEPGVPGARECPILPPRRDVRLPRRRGSPFADELVRFVERALAEARSLRTLPRRPARGPARPPAAAPPLPATAPPGASAGAAPPALLFRPAPRRAATPGVRFLDEPVRPTASTASAACRALPSPLEGLRDAFTGAPLDPTRGLFACRRCTVHYHAESVAVLRSENQGRCMACGGTDVRPVPVPRPAVASRPVPAPAAPAEGRNHTPDVVTLRTFRSYEGRVVTFEGRVANVLTSRRGSDYAVMFEDKPWVKGFKLVFFAGTLARFGGAAAIQALRGKRVRVRGLLVKHETYGDQIVVTEPSMLLAVA